MTMNPTRSVPGDSTERHESDHAGPELAERIRQERSYVGLSQADVAEVLGIPRAAVSALETGKRRVTGLELGRLAELFGTSVDRLLGRDVPADDTTAALFRATKSLTDADKEQVLRFAEFLRGAGQAPEVGRAQDVTG